MNRSSGTKRAFTAAIGGAAIGCALGGAIGCTLGYDLGVACSIVRRRLGLLAAFADPKTVQPRPVAPDVPAPEPEPEPEPEAGDDHAVALTHDENRLCIASASDGRIVAASVVDARGRLANLALPEDYADLLAVTCTDTDEKTGRVTFTAAALRLPGPGSVRCDPLSFQPGYYDRGTSTWHDRCTGRTTVLTAGPAAPTRGDAAVLAPEHCPLVASPGAVVWVSFVGDDVVRQVFRKGLLEAGVNLFGVQAVPPHTPRARTWHAGRHGKKFAYDHVLSMKGGAEHQVWFSYQYNYLSAATEANAWELPRTWGDFVEQRGEGARGDDPPFQRNKAPDVVFYGPGQLAVALDAGRYGSAVAGELAKWKGGGGSGRPPRLHLMLNVMPAPWLLSRRSKDRAHHTELEEYRKNLAILAAARECDCATSVADLFSAELPFHGERGGAAHGDAVHIHDWQVSRIVGDMIVDRLCHLG